MKLSRPAAQTLSNWFHVSDENLLKLGMYMKIKVQPPREIRKYRLTIGTMTCAQWMQHSNWLSHTHYLQKSDTTEIFSQVCQGIQDKCPA
jgi:hypothetical protein